MKKVMFLILFSIVLFSCEEKEQFIEFSESSVSMFYGDTKQLNVSYSSDDLKSKSYSFTSSDSTVVSISNTGLVTGVSIGSALVYIKSKDGKYTDECNFTITPKSNLYKEPYMVFGSSIATVKLNEKRNLSAEKTTSLVYTDTNISVRNVAYLFENGKMTSCAVFLTSTSSNATEVVDFLFERYKYDYLSGGMYFFSSRKNSTVAVMTVDVNLGLYVMYMPSSSSSMVQMQKIKQIKTISK